jgi:hypothetical protein
MQLSYLFARQTLFITKFSSHSPFKKRLRLQYSWSGTFSVILNHQTHDFVLISLVFIFFNDIWLMNVIVCSAMVKTKSHTLTLTNCAKIAIKRCEAHQKNNTKTSNHINSLNITKQKRAKSTHFLLSMFCFGILDEIMEMTCWYAYSNFERIANNNGMCAFCVFFCVSAKFQVLIFQQTVRPSSSGRLIIQSQVQAVNFILLPFTLLDRYFLFQIHWENMQENAKLIYVYT